MWREKLTAAGVSVQAWGRRCQRLRTPRERTLRLDFVILAAACALPLSAGTAGAQILFDWPLRVAPEPEAVLTGAPSALWNPAGTAEAGRELWLLDTEGSEDTDLNGLAVAATTPLPGRFGTLGVFFQHLGVDDIPRTDDSPTPLPGDIDVGESVFGLSVARPVGSVFTVGAGLRHARAGVSGDTRSRTSGDVGVQLHPALPSLSPRVGVSILDVGGDERVLAALSFALPRRWTGPFRLGLGYGIDTTTRGSTKLDQRASFRVTWLESFHGGVGLTFADGEDEVTPLWMAGADLGRYTLSVLRERLLGDFGAANFYQLTIRLP